MRERLNFAMGLSGVSGSEDEGAETIQFRP